MIWGKGSLKMRADHQFSLALSRKEFLLHNGKDVVIREGSGYVTAASPSREAWDCYFDSMVSLGSDPWRMKRRFDRAVKRWRAEK